MPIQLFTHTPLYVWAILAFLLWRGIAELREREIAPRRLLVLPLVMLALALHGILSTFGADPMALAAWLLGTAGAGLPAWRYGRTRIVPGAPPGRVRVGASAAPLVLMLALFALKYAVGAMLALQPHEVVRFAPAICALYGVFGGWFAARAALDVAAWRSQSAPPRASAAAITSGARL